MLNRQVIDSYTPTIGIECHVQLKTKSKLFSGADNDARDVEPNTAVSPLCLGLPGTLPVLNSQAVELAIRAGIALNAEIAPISSFDRKHYFYPDLPKGYQITQLERPIVGRGHVDVPLSSGEIVRVRINRAHIEEDAGKLTHPGNADYSLVDLNRAGTPLIEIVSEADIHSAEVAKAYAQELYLLMKYANVTNGDLYNGNMRFDINVSVAKKTAGTWGKRAEIKNLNSFRSVERAAEYEILRQIEILERGETVTQETRGWNDAKQKTFSQRSKAEAQDYRYFPEADIPPIVVTSSQIEQARKLVEPNLPSNIRQQLTAKGIPANDIATLLMYPLLLSRLLQVSGTATQSELKQISDLLINVLPAEFEKEPESDHSSEDILAKTGNLLKLVKLINDGHISATAAKNILRNTWKDFQDPYIMAEKMNLIQVSDEDQIKTIVDQVLNNPSSQQAIADLVAGNNKAIGYLIGQIMQKSQGKANPGLATKLILHKLKISKDD